MIQFVVGAAAGYVLGTKAGRKRYQQIKTGAAKVANSPITKAAVTSARKAVANKLDPEPRMKELKDVSGQHRFGGLGKSTKGGASAADAPQIYVPDAD